jgi:integrase
VLPFTEEEMKNILAACDTHPNPERGRQLKALVLLMRHSGLRIGDACTLSRDRIHKGMLELHTAKSGTKVRLPLNPVVLEALERVSNPGSFPFWNGESKRRTVVGVWENTFASLFKRAGFPGHSHRLRHSFAVGLLQKGVSMENVSTLLGHRSIKTTERHYASWVKARQEGLEKAIRLTW